MSLAKLISSPKSMPSALSMIVVGLMLTTCAGSLRAGLASALHLTLNQADFANGFFLGLGFTIEIFALVILSAHLRARRNAA